MGLNLAWLSGDKQLDSKGPDGSGRQVLGSEMSGWAQKDLVEGGGQAVALELAQLGGDKWLHSKGPTGSGSGRQALGSETSDQARKGLVEIGHEQLCLNWHG